MRNLILIVFDTARADYFEPWGASAGSTPVTAMLARTGTAPPLVIAPSPWTLPSHVSMFTGMHPSALGLTHGTMKDPQTTIGRRALLQTERERVLADVLRRHGYATAGISANAWINEAYGFASGFETFIPVSATRKWPTRKPRPAAEWALDAWRAGADDGAQEAATILRGWMDRVRADTPFFWFVNLMEAHSPYFPPRPFNDLSALQRLRAVSDWGRYQTPWGMFKVCAGALRMSNATVSRTRHLYARAIYQMDAWLGSLLEELDARAMLDDTLVVLTSDHGENLGEDGHLGHMLAMSERLLHVPLVFSSPVHVGHDGPISLVELPALLARGLALREHPWHDDVGVAGLAVAERPGREIPPHSFDLARARGVPIDLVEQMGMRVMSATDGTFKLVREEARERFYDLASDPSESSPLDSPPPQVALALRGAIERVDSLAPSGPGESPLPALEENAELEERLRQLGYL